MSIVIIGGNERMVCQYTDICKGYGYKAKIFPKENGSIRKKIGSPDLMVLFTNTVSHKMVLSASPVSYTHLKPKRTIFLLPGSILAVQVH